MTVHFEMDRIVRIARAALIGFIVLNGAPVKAATYNFFFNNTEQGANSTATPQLNVQGTPSGAVAVPGQPPPPPVPVTVEQVPGPDGQAVSQSMQSLTPVAPADNVVPVTPAPAPEVAPPAPMLETSPTPANARHRWGSPLHDWVRIAVVGGMGLDYEPGYWESKNLDEGYADWSNMVHANSIGAELSFLPSRHLSLNGWGGIYMSGGGRENSAFWGADLRLIPVRVGLFGMDNFMELSAGLGATSIAARADNLVSLYAVASANLGFGMDDVYLTSNLKFNQGFVMAEAGVGYRF